MVDSKHDSVPHLTGGFEFEQQVIKLLKPTRWVGYMCAGMLKVDKGFSWTK